MAEFYITIEKVPGDRRSEEFFSYVCDTEAQAWDYARDKRKFYGPASRVKSVNSICDRCGIIKTSGHLCGECGEDV